MNTGVRLCMTIVCFVAPYAYASTGIDSTNKYAWAENVGWANAAPTNGGVTVHFDGTSGYLTGYAWGENIGWIKMGDDTGGPYGNDSTTNWGVNLDDAGDLSGYAWGENVGWINFASSHNQVMIDMATGRFDGYAWGENVGWIKFKGVAPDYNVRTLAFDRQPHGTPNWWLAHHGVDEDHNEGDGVPAWREYVADTDPTDAASYFHISSISDLPPTTVSFASSPRRYYTLQHRDDLLSGVWTDVPGQIAVQGAGGPDSLQHSTSTTQQFYRVEVEVSP